MPQPTLPTPERAHQIRTLAAAGLPAAEAPAKLLTCRCGTTLITCGPVTSEWIEGCGFCGRDPMTHASPRLSAMPVRLTVESMPDTENRQDFTVEWINQRTGRYQAQCGRAVIDAQKTYWTRPDTVLVLVPFDAAVTLGGRSRPAAAR
jgi:hypothetical protein